MVPGGETGPKEVPGQCVMPRYPFPSALSSSHRIEQPQPGDAGRSATVKRTGWGLNPCANCGATLLGLQ
jgi:hypothetical protein